MTKEQQVVKDFMQKAGQDCQDKPTQNLTYGVKQLRWKLIQEELDEYLAATNVFETSDALGDLLYVVYGAAVAHGIDLEPIFEEIHRSNMTKFIDGHRREDGKWMKGPSYAPANLKPIIESQMK